MSAYEENYGKIYSDLARRLGVIAKQYDELKIDDKNKYESTLYVCILQNLLTQFDEIRKWATGRGKETFHVEPIWEEKIPFWGIESADVEIPNEENVEIGFLLDEIRDILSHPFPISNGKEYTAGKEFEKVIGYSFISRDRKTGQIDFKVTLESQQVKELVAHLSEYLSNIAQEITEENEDNRVHRF